jgi:hypothetical protein
MTEAHQNELRTWQGVTSNMLRNAALHAGTPWPDVNQWLWVQILKVHVKILKLDMNDPRTTSVGEFHILRAPDYGEVTVGNPVQAVFIIFTFLLSIFLIRKVGKLNLIYALTVSLTLVVFSYLFKWQIFSSRYHLPLFVLFAPSVGCIFSSLILHPRINPVISSLIGMLLLALCSPWLFHIDNRPLIPNTGGVLAGKSLLNDTRQNWYFATLGGGSGMFTPITSAILSTNCHEVGIMISGAGAEYPFWVLLGMPRNDMRIEWSVVDTPNERYRDPSFLPCALICDSCQNFDTFSNLPESVGDGSLLTKVLDNGFQLFIQE